MKIINPKVEVLSNITFDETSEVAMVMNAAKVCYKSEPSKTLDEAKEFIGNLIERGHLSPLEHVSVTVKFTTSRAVANEIVRHRIAAYNQESTRYCNYSKDKFDHEITVVLPSYLNNVNDWKYSAWRYAMENAEASYLALVNCDVSAQNARGVLPLDLKTEIICTYNLRMWRHVLDQRCAEDCHPDMRELMLSTLQIMWEFLPTFFGDIHEKYLGARHDV